MLLALEQTVRHGRVQLKSFIWVRTGNQGTILVNYKFTNNLLPCAHARARIHTKEGETVTGSGGWVERERERETPENLKDFPSKRASVQNEGI